MTTRHWTLAAITFYAALTSGQANAQRGGLGTDYVTAPGGSVRVDVGADELQVGVLTPGSNFFISTRVLHITPTANGVRLSFRGPTYSLNVPGHVPLDTDEFEVVMPLPK